MDLLLCQLNFGLNLDLDIEAQKKTIDPGTDKLYKLKVANKFEQIMFAIFILVVPNGFLVCLFLYLLSILQTFSVKIII